MDVSQKDLQFALNAKMKNRGAAMVVAILALAVVTALAAALATTSRANLRTAEHYWRSTEAFQAAEGGLHLAGSWMTTVVPHNSDDGLAGLLEDIQDQLPAADYFGGTAPSIVNGALVFPTLSLPDGKSFQVRIESIAGKSGRVKVISTGYCDEWQRSVSTELQIINQRSAIFDYGVVTRGPINMSGGTYFKGANSDEEGKLYSAWASDSDDALRMTGGPYITGDAYFEDPNVEFFFSGNPRVGGGGIWNGMEDINDHIHVGVAPIAFPEPDPSVFEPYATNYRTSVKSYYDRDLDKWVNEFHNVRIIKNSNPTIAGDVVLKGVIYIESPNRVHFSGGCQITGVIVTEDARDGNLKKNEIKFSGGTNLYPPEDLPDTSEFAQIRELTGTAILAPGFSLEFVGGFGTMGGTIAANEYKFAGGAGGTIEGTLLCYGEGEMKMSGGASFTFDHDDLPDVPAGFSGTKKIIVDWTAYQAQ
jgi:hypothetical protein